jgi:carboxymethylenebutenolidase
MNEELKSLLPKSDFTRREFVVTSLSAGFALATHPIAAQTVITTDTQGLIAGEVKIPTSDRQVPAYRALPEKGKSFPVVLVVQEIFGVHEHIKDLCRRLAKAGYLAIAPEMYARQGDVSSMTNIQEIVQNVVSKVPDAQVMSDLDAAVAWAAKNNGNVNKLAITGFCWGGRVVWLYSAHNPKLKAGAAWYGRLVGTASELTPKHPIDVVAQLKAPVLGLYGAADTGIPVDTVDKMKAAIAAQKGKSEIVLYPDTPHGFNADYRESYRQTQAKDAWAKMLAWFKQHGV